MAVMSLTTLFAIFQNNVISHKISRCKNSSVYKSQFCPFQVVFFLLHHFRFHSFSVRTPKNDGNCREFLSPSLLLELAEL